MFNLILNHFFKNYPKLKIVFVAHFSEHYHQNDLQSHLQQLRQIQEIEHHDNFLRSENDGVVLPLSEQGLYGNHVNHI